MRNWSSEFNKKIRKWLDIDTYRKFDSLTLQELYYEIWVRTLFFKDNPDEEEKQFLGMFYGKIVSGKPFLVTPQMVKNMDPDVRLYQPPHFFFTTTERLAQISVTAMLNEMYYWIGDNTYRINMAHSGKVITEAMEDKFPTSILLEVDLANGTDQEITESLKAALPQWRRFKGIPESPPEPVRFGHGTIKNSLTTVSYLCWTLSYGLQKTICAWQMTASPGYFIRMMTTIIESDNTISRTRTDRWR